MPSGDLSRMACNLRRFGRRGGSSEPADPSPYIVVAVEDLDGVLARDYGPGAVTWWGAPPRRPR